MITYWDALEALKSPVRQIGAKVELYNGSTLVNTFNSNDRLISFTIERIGDESKFFGFGVCQKLNVKLIDTSRELNITTANSFRVYYTINGEEIEDDYKTLYPEFNVTEVHRDENTNELSITAYDALYKANTLTFADLGLKVGTEYGLDVILMACNLALGFKNLSLNVSSHYALTVNYLSGGNFSGTETLREVLDAVTEVLQCIYYASDGSIVLIPIKADNVTMATITKDQYFTLESAENRRLTTITHTTELGDNISVTTGEIGTTQYLRDNPLLNLREDIDSFLNEAIARVGGLTINQFSCEWRGNIFLGVGDKIELITKDGNTVSSYLVNDVISYDGTLTETTQWHYEDNETETESNPATIGDALRQTYARVDKVNRNIELLASNISSNSEKIAALQINEEAISASVTKIEETAEEAIEGVKEDIGILTNKVNATMTSAEVKLEIQEEISKGVDKVTTATGFTFNDEGLTVSKTNSEMSTTITEDGMQVFKNDEAVLTANNIGVDAVNLHATTYLIIGNNSRFEDFGDNRTGCFWIGG